MSQEKSKTAITVAIIGLVGVIGAALITALVKPDSLSSPRTRINSDSEEKSFIYCTITRPFGLYLFEQPSEFSLVLATLAQNSSVEVESYNPNSKFTRVYASNINSGGWVNSTFLRCKN